VVVERVMGVAETHGLLVIRPVAFALRAPKR
jgi:hypothetical protein